MPIGSSATPLLALDAVVIDTETTGLDARKARVVEIALVPIVAGRLDAGAACRRLIRPDVAIPAQATRIHGIDAAAVADAPRFAEAWPELAALIGERVLIGHSVGFDLTVLTRECERAGLPWTRPRALDTRLLAEVAAPDLAGYSLENVAAWLEIEVTDRHSALGDALAAARAFQALLPRLREVPHPHAGGSRAGLQCAHRCAREAAPGRVARAEQRLGRRRCRRGAAALG